MNGRHRTSIALTAAALLTGAGAAVVANGVPAAQSVDAGPHATPPSPQSVELERSVTALLAQVSGLEAAIAAGGPPAAAPAAPAGGRTSARVTPSRPTAGAAPTGDSAEAGGSSGTTEPTESAVGTSDRAVEVPAEDHRDAADDEHRADGQRDGDDD